MNRNWLIAFFTYEGTLAVGRLVPFSVILGFVLLHAISMFNHGNEVARKANEKANRPPKEFTMAGLLEECRLEIASRGGGQKAVEGVKNDIILTACNPNGYLKYNLINKSGQVVITNDPFENAEFAKNSSTEEFVKNRDEKIKILERELELSE
ncbi:MAG: hypothetical protein WA947_08490 [Phormidesmis sp.]